MAALMKCKCPRSHLCPSELTPLSKCGFPSLLPWHLTLTGKALCYLLPELHGTFVLFCWSRVSHCSTGWPGHMVHFECFSSYRLVPSRGLTCFMTCLVWLYQGSESQGGGVCWQQQLTEVKSWQFTALSGLCHLLTIEVSLGLCLSLNMNVPKLLVPQCLSGPPLKQDSLTRYW